MIQQEQQGCAEIVAQLNQQLQEDSVSRRFTIYPARACPKGSSGQSPVDLVVVTDTSSSMQDEVAALSDAAEAAIKAARQNCPSDLRVAWFGIERTAAGKFTQTYRHYLHGLGVADEQIKNKPSPDGTVDDEDGAAAIVDLASHFDWRPGAARLIFYLGDEKLEGEYPQNWAGQDAVVTAVTVARKQQVKVYTYAGTDIDDDSKTKYKLVARKTKGQIFQAPAENIGGFEAVLEKIICTGTPQECASAQAPELRPCFELRWGNGPKDQIETEDVENIFVVASNPYTNVVLKDLVVTLLLRPKNQASVAALPDGTPAVEVTPAGPICFGDLSPCQAGDSGEIAREVVLVSRGTKAGAYTLALKACYSAEFILQSDDEFSMELVKS